MEPLQFLERIFSKVTSEFEKEWTLMKVQGWENNDQENGSAPVNHIGLGYSNTADELMEMGPENLKEVWMPCSRIAIDF
ncbi:uncharacterized protein LOC107877847 [Capsicum annuum]|uniref:uncharacterized protein LOC107877847 n=1 Tax=Capsicum annuum TaxID=4072 RepID=UPI001FB13630|nr:uncharacterized protein LOC107877847 [Capsicum annuum]